MNSTGKHLQLSLLHTPHVQRFIITTPHVHVGNWLFVSHSWCQQDEVAAVCFSMVCFRYPLPSLSVLVKQN